MSQIHYSSAANEYPIHVKTTSGFTKVQFSPDASRRLLSICSWDGFVKVFDLANPSSPLDVRTLYHKKAVLCSTFTVR
jgi:WD40 repeat protein